MRKVRVALFKLISEPGDFEFCFIHPAKDGESFDVPGFSRVTEWLDVEFPDRVISTEEAEKLDKIGSELLEIEAKRAELMAGLSGLPMMLKRQAE